MDPIRAARQAKSSNQSGDPAKAAQALLALVAADTPPVRLFLGEDALGRIDQKLDAMRAEVAAWDTLSRSTSFASWTYGIKDLIDNAEETLFNRWEGIAAVQTKGVYANGDKVFAHLTSSARTIDGLPYANEYLYILPTKDVKVVAGTARLDLHAYYDIINRVKV